jgi:hypothetical protein
MSYRSRIYKQRNPQSQETAGKKPFFNKQHDANGADKKTSFFQAKLDVNAPGDQYEHEADAVANAVVNNTSAKPVVKQKQISSVQRLATSMEDEKLGTNDQRMERDKEDKVKSVQRMGDPEKEKDKKVQKKDDPKKEEEKMKGVQRMGDPEKEKDKKVQKKDDPKKEEEKMKGVQRKKKKKKGKAFSEWSNLKKKKIKKFKRKMILKKKKRKMLQHQYKKNRKAARKQHRNR